MRREPPDSKFFTEIKDFNLEFLSLIASSDTPPEISVFGLDSGISAQVARFGPTQLDVMGDVPCLLAGFSTHKPRSVLRVAEPRPAEPDRAWLEHARLFAAELLTYVWQTTRRDRLRAALCIGADAQVLVRAATVRDIRSYADRAMQHLEARFLRHARFWPDLVRAARDGGADKVQLARLTAIQAATLETNGRGHVPAPRPLLARVGSGSL